MLTPRKQLWIGLAVTIVLWILWWPLGAIWAVVWWFDDVRPLRKKRELEERVRMAAAFRKSMGYDDDRTRIRDELQRRRHLG